MASQTETTNTTFNYFELTHAKLSDRMIGHVVPRSRSSDCDKSRNVLLQKPLETALCTTVTGSTTQHTTKTSDSFLSPRKGVQTSNGNSYVGASLVATSAGQSFRSRRPIPTPVRSLSQEKLMPMVNLKVSHKRLHDDSKKIENYEIKKAIRREQCRTNQARYRSRQRAYPQKLQLGVQQLQEELHGLKLKRQHLRSEENSNRSAWCIVTEVFSLLESSFRFPWHAANSEDKTKHDHIRRSLRTLRKSFLHDVAMGELSGIGALMEQLRRYSLYFDGPQLQLECVEETIPGVLTASARLSLTVSDCTIRCVFPHLDKPKGLDIEDEDGDVHQSLREKLLERRLDCSCKMTFLMDEESGRVARLETSVDWMGSLMRLLGDTSIVAKVLAQALLTQSCVVGVP